MIIDYESFIPRDSRIVGKTIGEVNKKFGLKIDHVHEGGITQPRINLKDNTILKAGMTIKICSAEPKTLTKFRKYYAFP